MGSLDTKESKMDNARPHDRSEPEREVVTMPRAPHTKRQRLLLTKLDWSILLANLDGRFQEARSLRSVRRELAQSFALCKSAERKRK